MTQSIDKPTDILSEALRVRRMNRPLRGVNYDTMSSDEATARALRSNDVTTLQRSGHDDEAADKAYEYLKKNHPDLHNYITRQAPVPIDPVMAARDARNMGSHRVLSMIKDFVKRDTKNIYGKDFPTVESFNMELEDYLAEAYDPDRTWKQYGEAITKNMISQRITSPDHDDAHHRATFEAHAAEGDPTPNKAYTTWLANKYAKGGINHLEDFGRARAALTQYHRAKLSRRLDQHGISPDIGSFKTLPDLEAAVDRLPQEEKKYSPPAKVADSERTKLSHDGWSQTIPHTWDASCKYGAGTKWCTQGEWGPSHYNRYSRENPLHILIPDEPRAGEGHGRIEKYQLHYGRDGVQFKDLKDIEVSPQEVFKGRPLSNEHLEMIRPSIEHAMAHGYPVNDKGMFFIDKDTAGKWVDREEPGLRRAAASAGNKEHLDKLVNDPDSSVRAAVASHDHEDLLNKLVNDPSAEVRKNVALHNHKDILDKLVKDPSPGVRLNVLNHGHEDHVDAMIDTLFK